MAEITPELLIVLASLEARREDRGTEWCRKHGLGAVRRLVERKLPAHVIAHPATATYPAAQDTAISLLGAVCRACRGCKMGRE